MLGMISALEELPGCLGRQVHPVNQGSVRTALEGVRWGLWVHRAAGVWEGNQGCRDKVFGGEQWSSRSDWEKQGIGRQSSQFSSKTVSSDSLGYKRGASIPLCHDP